MAMFKYIKNFFSSAFSRLANFVEKKKIEHTEPAYKLNGNDSAVINKYTSLNSPQAVAAVLKSPNNSTPEKARPASYFMHLKGKWWELFASKKDTTPSQSQYVVLQEEINKLREQKITARNGR